MNTIEELRAQLNKLEEQEREKLINEAFPEFQKLVGKCFKYKNYLEPSNWWWLYRKVISIKKDDLYLTKTGSDNKVLSHCVVFEFQTNNYGEINIRTNNYGYSHGLGEEISEKVFNKELEKVKEKINSL